MLEVQQVRMLFTNSDQEPAAHLSEDFNQGGSGIRGSNLGGNSFEALGTGM